MKNDDNPRPKKQVKVRPTSRPEPEEVAAPVSEQPVNDKRTHHQPHDTFIKLAFENKEIAIDFFASHLDKEIYTRENLEKFLLDDREHPRPGENSLHSDVVYCGSIRKQIHYIALEHQSSFDKTIVARQLEYAAALMKKHVAQNKPGQAIVVPICLYHEPHHNSDPINKSRSHLKSMMERLLGDKEKVRSFMKAHPITAVDLTIMTDDEIKTHGEAAIVEWLLQDSQLPGDNFLLQAIKHLKLKGYSSANHGTTNFRSAILKYIMGVYNGNKTEAELIDQLCKVMPQERRNMGKFAENLRLEGMQQGIQQGRHDEVLRIVNNMLSKGMDLLSIKEVTGLADEELAEISPTRTDSTSSPRTLENILGTQLVQSISATAEQTASGENITTASNHGRGMIPTIPKSSRD